MGPWPALFFVWRRTAANRFLGMLRRVREPRYAAGLVAGVAYFVWIGWFMLVPQGGGEERAPLYFLVDAGLPPILAVLALGWWLSGRTHMALAFTPAEVQFYFQAPISRRTLLHYKLAKAQVGMAPLAVLFTLGFAPLWPLPGHLTLMSLWGLMTLAHLHQLASGLLRASWAHQGRASLRRQWVPLALLVAAGASMLWAVWPLVGVFRGVQEPIQMGWAIQGALGHPAAALVLLPFHMAVAPLAATDVTLWAQGMVGLLGMAVLHYMWVLRIDAAFEELAADAGVELQAIQQAFREGRLTSLSRSKDKPPSRPWFRIGPRGHPAVAVFWKNFTAFTRSLSVGSILTLPLTFFGFWALLRFAADDPNDAAVAAASLPLLLVPLTLAIGPLFLRNDFRTDFQRLEMVRTWPMTGRDLVAAEVAGAAASLTLILFSFLGTSLVIVLMSGAQLPFRWIPWAGVGAGLLVLPLASAVAVGLQNVLAVNFPAWIQFGPAKQQGLDQMGGMIVVMLLTSVLLSLAYLVPVGVGAVVTFRLFLLVGDAAIWPGLAAFWLALVAEVALLVTLLGDAYDEMDPSAEGLLP